jgi:hypothetical protein
MRISNILQLYEALKSNTSQAEIDLSGNLLLLHLFSLNGGSDIVGTERGLVKLFEALKSNTSLASLKIRVPQYKT